MHLIRLFTACSTCSDCYLVWDSVVWLRIKLRVLQIVIGCCFQLTRVWHACERYSRHHNFRTSGVTQQCSPSWSRLQYMLEWGKRNIMVFDQIVVCHAPFTCLTNQTHSNLLCLYQSLKLVHPSLEYLGRKQSRDVQLGRKQYLQTLLLWKCSQNHNVFQKTYHHVLQARYQSYRGCDYSHGWDLRGRQELAWKVILTFSTFSSGSFTQIVRWFFNSNTYNTYELAESITLLDRNAVQPTMIKNDFNIDKRRLTTGAYICLYTIVLPL